MMCLNQGQCTKHTQTSQKCKARTVQVQEGASTGHLKYVKTAWGGQYTDSSMIEEETERELVTYKPGLMTQLLANEL